MRRALTISLPPSMSDELDKVTKEEGITRSDVARVAISDYLYTKRFQKLRDKMSLLARSKGVFTDEDVFNKVS